MEEKTDYGGTMLVLFVLVVILGNRVEGLERAMHNEDQLKVKDTLAGFIGLGLALAIIVFTGWLAWKVVGKLWHLLEAAWGKWRARFRTGQEAVVEAAQEAAQEAAAGSITGQVRERCAAARAIRDERRRVEAATKDVQKVV